MLWGVHSLESRLLKNLSVKLFFSIIILWIQFSILSFLQSIWHDYQMSHLGLLSGSVLWTGCSLMWPNRTKSYFQIISILLVIFTPCIFVYLLSDLENHLWTGFEGCEFSDLILEFQKEIHQSISIVARLQGMDIEHKKICSLIPSMKKRDIGNDFGTLTFFIQDIKYYLKARKNYETELITVVTWDATVEK